MDPVQRVVVALDAFQGRAVRLIATEVTAELVEHTPVDTGNARANWIPSVGAPVTKPDGSREAVSNAAQQTGLAQVALYKPGQGVVFIANNVPYIGRLKDGWSPQAPAGWVEASIERGINSALGKLGGG